MPVTYRIDRELNRILTRCTGETVLKEVLGHFAELEADPDCPPHADVLLPSIAKLDDWLSSIGTKD